MSRTSTLSDVARRAGVHQATASRALNPASRHLVNHATAERVLAAARELGYVPNAIARGLRTSRTGTVGVIIPDLMNPLFPPIVRGIEDVLAQEGYTALLANTDNDEQRERALFESLVTRRVDGFIVATARRTHPLLDEAARRGLKVVLVYRGTDRTDFCAVTADDWLGITLATEHLIELGHRRIGHLAGPQDVYTGSIRARSFNEALRSHDQDVPAEHIVVCDAYSEAAGVSGTRRLLDQAPDLTAIVAANDLLALGACDVLRERGLRCPDQVSVTGFNDMPFADKFDPPLTTVRVPHYDLGAEAGRLLLDQLTRSGPHPTKRLSLTPTLIKRGSTAPPSIREAPSTHGPA
ncbi:MAG TPA: LacI family DNA-binding transcriptional regulator [Actinocrinis sp.]|uniref:LacI family DNA-binding transcriptional regulator n=1 Tax=Actinocrinis sp. TaxID=1920516 RepID=UPI002D42358F|nr:LacI family DNA-binding transcriptional regulator [Actinocrinis sp.]HZU56340.1 LacI family DNA-binding transcriptional regulator [Actinocrinis sp.]